jgi:hypothetical protein
VAAVIAAFAYASGHRRRVRDQAERVAVWFEQGDDFDTCTVHVFNGSDRAIRNVDVRSETIEAESLWFPIVPPGAKWEEPAAIEVSPGFGHQGYAAGLSLKFDDEHGRRWQRNGPRSRLRKVPNASSSTPSDSDLNE